MSIPDYAEAYARPEIYDVLHSPHTEGEVDLFQDCARRWDAPAGRWLEPACGSGRYLRVLAARGIRCTGFDLDEGMLDYARASMRGAAWRRRVTLRCANMARFSDRLAGSPFAVAFNPVNTFRHLHSPRAAAEHLREIARVLVPGGLYLVGMSFSRYGDEEASEDVWTAQRGDIAVRQIVQYLPPDPDERMETVISHLQVDGPTGREYLDASYRLRSYDLGQWKGLVRRSPLRRVGALDDLGNVVTDDVETSYQVEVLRRD
jgi:SAM-dependent methyltransferase